MPATPFLRTLLAAAVLSAAAGLVAAPPARAAVPNFGAFANSYGGDTVGGEGSFQAMSSTKFPQHHKYDYSWSMASLGDGSLHAGSSATPVPCTPWRCPTSGSSAITRFWDTVTFENGGANMGLLGMSLTIDGTLTTGLGQSSAAYARWYTGSARWDFFDILDLLAPAQQLSAGVTVLGDDLLVPIGNSTMFIFAELYTTATSWGSPSSADFGHTLRFDWTLPEGVTVTSASGRFMTEAAPPSGTVPEPSAALLLASGMGMLALRRAAAGRHREAS